jgi:hypothetical protein
VHFSYVTNKLTISGAAALEPGTYCFPEIAVQSGGTLTISGLTTITVNGKLTISGGGFANTTHNPDNLIIYSSRGTSDAVTSSGGGTESYMRIIAPNPGAKVTVSGGGTLHGSVIGYDVVVTGGSTVIDESSSGAVLVGNWREVQN